MDTLVAGARASQIGSLADLGALDVRDAEPWGDPVDGANILDDIVAMIRRYVVLELHEAYAIALWILHTHVLDAFSISPRLAIQSPVPECGKTTLLSLVGHLVRRPLTAVDLTGPALFRTIELYRATVMLDEANNWLTNDRGDLLRLLDAGHRRGGQVVRLGSGPAGNYQPQFFKLWGAVAIALIGQLPPQLQSRCVTVSLRRRRADEAVQRFRTEQMNADLEEIARRAAQWASDNLPTLRALEPQTLAGLSNRNADNWSPLLTIAEVAGPEWRDRARQAARMMTRAGQQDDGELRVELLIDLYRLFADEPTDTLFTREILARLRGLDGRPWTDCDRGGAISKGQLAKLLKAFNVSPRSVRRGNRTGKGYRPADFADAFARYVPDAVNATVTHTMDGASEPSQITTADPKTEKFGDSKEQQPQGDATGTPPKLQQIEPCDVVTPIFPVPDDKQEDDDIPPFLLRPIQTTDSTDENSE